MWGLHSLSGVLALVEGLLSVSKTMEGIRARAKAEAGIKQN